MQDLKDLTDAELIALIQAAMPEIKPAGSLLDLEPLAYPVMDEGVPMALVRELDRRNLTLDE